MRFTPAEDGELNVEVTSFDDEAAPRNFYRTVLRLVSPDLEPTQTVLEQVGPGRYAGTVRADEPGAYLVRVAQTFEDESGTDAASRTLGIVSPAAEEYRRLGIDADALATYAGGRRRPRALPLADEEAADGRLDARHRGRAPSRRRSGHGCSCWRSCSSRSTSGVRRVALSRADLAARPRVGRAPRRAAAAREPEAVPGLAELRAAKAAQRAARRARACDPDRRRSRRTSEALRQSAAPAARRPRSTAARSSAPAAAAPPPPEPRATRRDPCRAARTTSPRRLTLSPARAPRGPHRRSRGAVARPEARHAKDEHSGGHRHERRPRSGPTAGRDSRTCRRRSRRGVAALPTGSLASTSTSVGHGGSVDARPRSDRARRPRRAARRRGRRRTASVSPATMTVARPDGAWRRTARVAGGLGEDAHVPARRVRVPAGVTTSSVRAVARIPAASSAATTCGIDAARSGHQTNGSAAPTGRRRATYDARAGRRR